MSPSTLRRRGTRSLRVVLVVALASLAALALLQGAAAAADAPTAPADEDRSTDAHGADEPLPPEEITGRWDLQTVEDYPYSAIGTFRGRYDFGTTGTPSGKLDGWQSSGVLISDRHVLTAGHVLTNDGVPRGFGNTRFAPAYRNASDVPHRQPFGDANVTDVDIHPKWLNEQDRAYDMAVVTLDRPVGASTGTMEIEGGWAGDLPASHDLNHAGYWSNVSGHRMTISEPTTYDYGTRYGELHEVCQTSGDGDSGSPIWHQSDGEATVVSLEVADAHPDSPCDINRAFGVEIRDERVTWIRERMAEDGPAPEGKADLVAASDEEGPQWVRGPSASPSETIDDLDESLQVRTVVYNNGGEAFTTTDPTGGVEVRFFASERNRVELCSDTIGSLGAYDSTTVSCEAEDLSGLELYQPHVDIEAVIDPQDRIPEHGDEANRFLVGSLPADTGADIAIERVDVPEYASAGTSSDVTVELANRGTADGSVDVSVDAEEGSCDPSVKQPTLRNSPITKEVAFQCDFESPTFVTREDREVTVTVGDETVTETITVTEIDLSNDARFEVTDVEFTSFADAYYLAPGDTYRVSATFENVGTDAGVREVGWTAGGGCANYEGDTPHWEAFELDPGETGSYTLKCDIRLDTESFPSDGLTENTLDGAFQIANHADQRDDIFYVSEHIDQREWWDGLHESNDDVTIDDVDGVIAWDRRSDLQVDRIEGPDRVTVEETATYTVHVDNQMGADRQDVELRVGGQTLDSESLRVQSESENTVQLRFEPDSDLVGDRRLTVRTGDDAVSRDVTVDPAPAAVEVEHVRDPLMHGAERVQVNGTVTAPLGASGEHTVTLAHDGVELATRSFDLDAGEQRRFTIEGPIDVDETDEPTVSLHTDGDRAARTVDVAPPIDVVVTGDEPARPGGPDGLYLDLTGDGSVGYTDVVTLFENLYSAEVRNNQAYFDYTGDGTVGQTDVVEFNNAVARGDV